MQTHGCIRVYNTEMAKLVKIIRTQQNSKKRIYCYIEDYSVDISDVYKSYGMSVDSKDKDRNHVYDKNKTQ